MENFQTGNIKQDNPEPRAAGQIESKRSPDVQANRLWHPAAENRQILRHLTPKVNNDGERNGNW